MTPDPFDFDVFPTTTPFDFDEIPDIYRDRDEEDYNDALVRGGDL